MKRGIVVGMVLLGGMCWAGVRFGSPFGDGMVLQREKPVRVWGTAAAGERVAVTFADQRVTAQADAAGNWEAELKPLTASKAGRVLRVTSQKDGSSAQVKDVLVGEVWFAGGQSNMGVCFMWHDPRFGDEKGAMLAQYKRRPYIRYATCNGSSVKPVREADIQWKEWNAKNIASGTGPKSRRYGFSAVASYFALELYGELDVPIGIIASYNGGTNIEAWMPRESFESDPVLKPFLDVYPVPTEKWTNTLERGGIRGGAFRQPTVLWNRGIEPFTPFTIRGAIWYQGCNNVCDATNYCRFSHALYKGWAKKFREPNLPFLFVQLADMRNGANWPILQEQQAKFAAEEPNAGMAVISDIGNVYDVHAPKKELVAQRLAILAFKRLYGYNDITADSPVVESWKIEKGKFVLTFRHAKRMYVYNENKSLDVGFEVAGKDGVWKKAEILNFKVEKDKKGRETRDGEIYGNVVEVGAKDVAEPVMLRYLHQSPFSSRLFSEVNLPVGVFHLGY